MIAKVGLSVLVSLSIWTFGSPGAAHQPSVAAHQPSVAAQQPSVATRLASNDATTRAMAACELGRQDAAAVRPHKNALLAMLGDDTPVEAKLCRDWEYRNGRDEKSSPGREAAMALEDLGGDVLPDLVALLRDPRPAAREHAAFALGLIESTAAVQPLAGLVDDPDPRVRARAAWSLGMIESAEGVDPLARLLRDADVNTRAQAAWGLGMIESKRGVPPLTSAAADRAPEVRAQVAWALGMIESADGVEPLTRLLGDADAEVREQAAWGLGMIESKRAVAALVAALGDPEAEVRSQVAWALGMIEDAGAANAIAAALERETDKSVRKNLVWALTQIIDDANLDMSPRELAALLRKALLSRDGGAAR